MDWAVPNIGWANLVPTLDRNSIVPLYRQLYEHLREAILAGTIPESTRLPPERAMSERLECQPEHSCPRLSGVGE